MRRLSRPTLGLATVIACTVAVSACGDRGHSTASKVAVVQRGTLRVLLTTPGTLKPAQSVTYRSPVPGKELEVAYLAPEGTRVETGDVLIRLDASELEGDAERLGQELRQLQLDLQQAHAERQDAESKMRMETDGEGALAVFEARTRLQVAQKKAERQRREHEALKPLLAKGVVSGEEVQRIAERVAEAEQEVALAEKRANVLEEMTHPRDRRRAALLLAQKVAEVEHVVGRVEETDRRLQQLRALAERCTIHAKGPGLVVYEQLLHASPRRKVRVGDRVTASQVLVTIPEVKRMLVESSIGEADLHRAAPGQTASIALEAFPQLQLTGRVIRVGSVADVPVNGASGDKRFALVIEIDPSDAELRPEMTARVQTLVRTRENVLLVPVAAVFEEGKAFLAYVAGSESFEARTLELGESNTELVEVVAGLAENDRVLLAKPAGAANKRPARSPVSR